MPKRIMLVIIAFLVIALSYYWYRIDHVPLTAKTIDGLGLSFQYPAQAKIQPLSGDDEKNKVDFRLKNSEQDPLYQVVIRHEDGLRLVTTLTRQEMIPMLLRNSDRSFTLTFPGYTKLSSREFELSGHKVGEVYFTYMGKNGERAKQRFVILSLDEGRAVYISAQSKEIDFDQLNRKYFDKIFTSFLVR